MPGSQISTTMAFYTALYFSVAMCPGSVAGPVDSADWTASLAEAAEVEQTQFRRSRSRNFGRPSIAGTLPEFLRSASTRRTSPRRLLARAAPTQRRRRLSRTPDMLGDSFLPSCQLILQPQAGRAGLTVDTPLAVAGGSARTKIAEQNKAIPVDRVFLSYNHFNNAIQRQVVSSFGDTAAQSANVDRLTLGVERTLLRGDASVALRLPLTGYPDLRTLNPNLGPAGHFQSETGVTGNLSFIGKQLLMNDENFVLSCGLGIEFPTGANASVLSGNNLYRLDNQSLFLQPFFAMTFGHDNLFFHSFLQADVDAAESSLSVSNVANPGPRTGLGNITQQTLVHWDTAAGLWLARSDERSGVTGIAAIMEFHLSSATSSPGQIAGTVPSPNGAEELLLTSTSRNYSASYLTTGIHAEMGRNRTVRVAGVWPLRNGVEEFFDVEFLVQSGWRY